MSYRPGDDIVLHRAMELLIKAEKLLAKSKIIYPESETMIMLAEVIDHIENEYKGALQAWEEYKTEKISS